MREKRSDEPTTKFTNFEGKLTLDGFKHFGVFDSGLGGLTVLRALAQRGCGENFTYFGDTARVPYGAKSPATVCRYAMESAELLLERGSDILIVACNTASAYALDLLREELTVPVIGMVEPGVEAAASVTRGRVGVLATEGTIRSGVYQRALQANSSVEFVRSVPCPLLVPLVEEGLLEHGATELLAMDYLSPLLEDGIDTLLLACTHYPILRPVLQRLCGSEITIVDSAEACARSFSVGHLGTPQSFDFLVSDDPEKFQKLGQDFFGADLCSVKQIDSGRLSV